MPLTVQVAYATHTVQQASAMQKKKDRLIAKITY